MTREEFQEYCKMGFSVTLVLFGFEKGELKIFIQRLQDDPYMGAWSLPGKLIEPEIGLQQAAEGILEQTIGSRTAYLEQLNAFGKVYRHPYGRVICIAFYGLVNLKEDFKIKSNYKDYKWTNPRALPEMAYDHNEIVDFSLQRLKRRLVNRPIGFKLLPKKFTLSELQSLYESILNTELDKRNFRKKLKKLEILEELDTVHQKSPGRNPSLYRFIEDKYYHYLEHGF